MAINSSSWNRLAAPSRDFPSAASGALPCVEQLVEKFFFQFIFSFLRFTTDKRTFK